MKKLIYYILNFFSHNLERKILENFKGKKKLIIFDVGCFKGVFSRKIFSLIKNRRSKFYLFDINKNTKNYISDLISLKNFNLFEVALSNKNGTAIYNHNRFFESSCSSLSNLYRTDAKWVLSRKIFLKFFFQSTKDYSRYKVKTTTLDSFVKKKGINLTLFDARFVKPLDENTIWQLARDHETIISIEEGSIGGFGSHVSQYLFDNNLIDNNLKFRSMILPDRFIDHDKPEQMYKYAGLDASSIETKILDTLNSKVVIKKSN